jgi:hypothetical protein
MEKLDDWSILFYMSKRILVAIIFVLLAVNIFEMVLPTNLDDLSDTLYLYNVR